MVAFMTYSNDLYAATRNFSARMAIKKGKVDKVIVYKPEDINIVFYTKHKNILDNPIGNGFWLWKPYFVNKALNELNNGDVLLYCDAASFLFRSCEELLASMTDDIWVSNIPFIEKQYTKPEVLEYMGCTDEQYTESNQVQASILAVRKSDRAWKFVNEWLEICEMEWTLTRETRYEADKPDFEFIQHRSDQSILSLLSKKWGIVAHLDPSQYGRFPERYFGSDRIYKEPENRGEYRPCMILHRCRVPEKGRCFKDWLYTWAPLPFLRAISVNYKEYRSFLTKGNQEKRET